LCVPRPATGLKDATLPTTTTTSSTANGSCQKKIWFLCFLCLDDALCRPGNAGWLSGYFSDTLLAPFWLPGLVTLTVTENIAGFAAALACWQYVH